MRENRFTVSVFRPFAGREPAKGKNSQINHKTHSKKSFWWLLDTIFELLYVIVHMTLWDIIAIFKHYGPKYFELYIILIDSIIPLPP